VARKHEKIAFAERKSRASAGQHVNSRGQLSSNPWSERSRSRLYHEKKPECVVLIASSSPRASLRRKVPLELWESGPYYSGRRPSRGEARLRCTQCTRDIRPLPSVRIFEFYREFYRTTILHSRERAERTNV